MRKIQFSLFFILLAFMANAQNLENSFPKKQLITTGVYYYPEHWDSTQWDRDLKNMAAMGFEFTHFAEFAWAQLEPEEGKYDFAWLDKAVSLAAKYNLKVIMCTSTCTPPVWLSRKHPEILSMNENGRQMDHGSRQHASFSSSYYRSYSLKMIEQLARHYGRDPRINGWQVDNEPRTFFDYNPDAQQRFRAWLKNKYKDINALNNTWGTLFWSNTYSDFSEINIPLHSQWGMNLNQRLDHYRFAASETATFLDEQAVAIKKHASSNQWVTTNYIPNYDGGYIGKSTELDFITYTRYMVFGSSMGIGRKGYRLGDPLSIAMANDFFRPKSQIYGVMELQPGQVNWGSINPQPAPGAVRLWLWHQFAGGSTLACTYRYRAPLVGYEQYHYGIVGTDGVTPTPGGLEYQKFIQETALLRKEYRAEANVPAAYLARKTAILFNNENIWGMDMNKQTSQWNSMEHFIKYYKTLKAFGAPVDFIEDHSDFSKYPVLIAPAYQQIDKDLIQKMTDYAASGGKLVLTCRSGHKNREGHLWEARFAEPIYGLIGAEIEFYDLPMPHAQDSVWMGSRKYAWKTWGEILSPKKETSVWGTFQGDFYAGKPAVISRKLGKGSVTYVGVDSNDGLLERDLLKKLYAQLEIPVDNLPEGVSVEYRNGFGIAVNYSDKNYTLKIPDDAQILIGEKVMPTAGVTVWKLK
ncbi:MAG TPA: beta-galactosidase [Prolixibacteraceae bacterium]|nr:beta-galactosidase [Prolixibacteraceae bacterium]